ncbi:TrkA C-terminal domain-containing protein [Nocardia fluminea]|uniref:TrkA C-terminal domain-containing protein n=1 Tax=Nocardia fluminea TaxID=134984 RepID=UPI0037FC8BCC
MEARILTTSLLAECRIPKIWAKATSLQQGQILERVGAHHVVLPEHNMDERVAHLVTGRMIDYIEFDADYAMAKTTAPRSAIGKTLTNSGLRQHFDITVVAIKHRGAEFTYATADSVVAEGDQLIVSGRIEEVERFADLT